MANINNKLEYICENAQKDPKDFVLKSESRYKRIIESVCEQIMADSSREIIMLAGPSASGKTTTAAFIREELAKKGHKAYVVSLDDFYLDIDKMPLNDEGKADYESVKSLDLELVEKCFTSLIEKSESDMPTFDFLQKKRFFGRNHIKLEKGDVVIVEGLHALNPVITDKLPKESLFKIYVSVSSRIYDEERHIILNKRNLRFIRRLVRDYYYRNSTTQNTFELWQNVLRGEDEYLFPYRFLADARINSVHIYEPCVLKDVAIEMLGQLPEDSKFRKDAQRLIRDLEKFPNIENSLVPHDSLLREFVGVEL